MSEIKDYFNSIFNQDQDIKSLKEWRIKAEKEIKELFRESQENFRKAQEAQTTAEDSLQSSIDSFQKAKDALQKATQSQENANSAYSLASTLQNKAEQAFSNANLAYNNALAIIEQTNLVYMNLKSNLTSMINSLNEDTNAIINSVGTTISSLKTDTLQLNSKIKDVGDRIGWAVSWVADPNVGFNAMMRKSFDGFRFAIDNTRTAVKLFQELNLAEAWNRLNQIPSNIKYSLDGAIKSSTALTNLVSHMNDMIKKINEARAQMTNMFNHLEANVNLVNTKSNDMKNNMEINLNAIKSNLEEIN